MKLLMFILLFSLNYQAVLSHGDTTDCSDECKLFYCPKDNSEKRKENSIEILENDSNQRTYLFDNSKLII